ncbi:MAG: peptidoglycan DD-metalloendopeptidase family protein [Phyllobacterium sp.]
MRKNILDSASRRLARNAAILIIAGMGAGCSSDIMRFGGGDYTYTGSIPKQSVNQQPRPYTPPSSAPVDGTYTSSVARGAANPVDLRSSGGVQRGALPPVSSAPQAASTSPALAPVAAAAPAATQVAAAPSSPQIVPAGGTRVIVESGQTLSSIARRYGVSSSAILQANGISDPNRILVGQSLLIPGAGGAVPAQPAAAPVQTAAAPEQAPQNPAAPQPLRLPTDNSVAILPQNPQLKEKQAVAESMTAATPKATPPSAGGTYTVQSGDTIHAIARKTGATTTAIKQANNIQNGVIRIGQRLVIPAAGATTVASAQPVDPVKTSATPANTAAKPASTVEASGKAQPYTPPQASSKVTEQAEKEVASAPTSTGISQMRWPVKGRVITGYGQRNGSAVNDGIDIMVPEGTPVKAAENGVVIYAGNGLKEFGNTVLVRHDNGLVTVYGHNSAINVQRGQKVRRGDELGRSGMSGNASSPRLHFEVRKDSTPVDPSKYLEG